MGKLSLRRCDRFKHQFFAAYLNLRFTARVFCDVAHERVSDFDAGGSFVLLAS
eukprot:m.37578 g.37578  ORF g.37578 m.37578 type:complete len:53 (+) comp14573_c0_seq1:439-597(+)